MRRHVRLWTTLLAAVTLAAAGLTSCGGGGGSGAPAGNTPVTLLATDAPPSSVQSFEVDLGVELVTAGGSTVPVTGRPIRVEFVRLLGFTAVIGRPSIMLSGPATFTAVRLTLSRPEITLFVNGMPEPVTLEPPALVLQRPTVEVQLAQAATATPGRPFHLLIDLDLARSISVSGTGMGATATVDPVFRVRQVRDLRREIEADDLDDLDDLIGTVASVDLAGQSFQLQVGLSMFTVVVNEKTEFEDFPAGDAASLADLQPGQVVEVDGELQADGVTVLAEEVELKEVNEVTGIVAEVAPPDPGTPADSFQLLQRGSVPDLGFQGPIVTVNLSADARFKVNKENLDVGGFSFDASHLAVGQRVTVANLQPRSPSGSAVPLSGADNLEEHDGARLKVILKKEAVDGTVVPGSVSADGFVLRVTSSLAALFPGGTLDLRVEVENGRTNFVHVSGLDDLQMASPDETFRVTGLIFRQSSATASATDVVMLAKKIRKLTAGNM